MQLCDICITFKGRRGWGFCASSSLILAEVEAVAIVCCAALTWGCWSVKWAGLWGWTWFLVCGVESCLFVYLV